MLELAAGDGALSAVLAWGGCAVVANDLRVDHLRQNLLQFVNGRDVEVLGGNLFELDPTQAGCFDLVVACEIIEHVAHTRQFLEHIRRFINPGGKLLLTTPNGSYFRNKLPTFSEVEDFDALESQQFKPDADGHLFLLTPRELLALAEASGYNVDSMSVWATPLLTGHCKLARFASRALVPLAYSGEKIAQRLPTAMRNRICSALSAVLSPKNPYLMKTL